MPYARLFYHLVWSTKNRLSLIGPDIEERLYSYLCQKASDMGAKVHAVNGLEDHIHLIIEIPPKISVAEAIKRMKGASSHEFSELHWQRGYGALSISERNLDLAIDYVQNQKEHHKQQTALDKLERCYDVGEKEFTSLKDDAAEYEVEGTDIF
jgi:putative transposase